MSKKRTHEENNDKIEENLIFTMLGPLGNPWLAMLFGYAGCESYTSLSLVCKRIRECVQLPAFWQRSIHIRLLYLCKCAKLDAKAKSFVLQDCNPFYRPNPRLHRFPVLNNLPFHAFLHGLFKHSSSLYSWKLFRITNDHDFPSYHSLSFYAPIHNARLKISFIWDEKFEELTIQFEVRHLKIENRLPYSPCCAFYKRNYSDPYLSSEHIFLGPLCSQSTYVNCTYRCENDSILFGRADKTKPFPMLHMDENDPDIITLKNL